MNLKTNFSCGERIKELRNERSLSQERLALNAGITPAYLGLVERGKRNATVATIECVCVALNISLADFFAPANVCDSVEDDIGKQILHQLVGLSTEEKQAILQLVKGSLHLRQLGVESK
ncbi:MAG: helix-turn-helix transcriptional regulator [Ruminococcaceae bacterium]|nr:helix-turn-helix transcriptional regulator [Oscillospiraceae bacterium]